MSFVLLLWPWNELFGEPSGDRTALTHSQVGPTSSTTAPFFKDVELPAELELEDVADADRVTRDEAIRGALADNPAIKAARERLEAARGSYRSRTAANNPQGAVGASLVPHPSTAEDAAVSQFPDTDQTHLSYTFPTSGRRRFATRAAEAQFESARKDLVTAELDLRQAVAVAYVDLQVAQEVVDLYEDTVRIATALVGGAQQQYRAGGVPEGNVFRAQIEASRATQDLVRSHADLAVKQAALAFQMGRRVDRSIAAADPLEATVVALSQEQACELAFAGRSEIASARAQAQALVAEVDVARSARRPDLNLQVHPTDSLTNAGDPPIFAAISLPLWDRGQIGGTVDAARAQARAAGYLVEAARRQVVLDVAKAYQPLIANRKNLQLIRTQVRTKTGLLLERMRIAYAAGSATLLDLLDAQRIYRQSALDELQALGDLERSVVALERAMAASLPREKP